MSKSAAERFFARVVKRDDGCWEWTGYVHPRGYGGFFWNGRLGRAHRFAYEHFVGPIPDGLVLDHLCRVRNCVNPAHLEAVTNTENLRRGVGTSAVNFAKTHCMRGHPLFGEGSDVRLRERAGYGTERVCRTCRVIRERKNRQLARVGKA